MATTPLDAASAIPTPGAAERPRDPRPALATFYFAQFLHLGIIVPFLPIWLEGRGFSALAIGALLALPSIFKVAAPWLWARWADRSGRRKELFVVAVAGAAIALGVLVRPSRPHPSACCNRRPAATDTPRALQAPGTDPDDACSAEPWPQGILVRWRPKPAREATNTSATPMAPAVPCRRATSVA